MKVLDPFKGSKGFTLVELMIAIVIMTIAFTGLATMQIACINGNTIANNLTSGVTLAQDKLEELKSLHYDEQDLADSNTGNNADLTDETNFDHRELHVNVNGEVDQSASPPDGYIYTRVWNVADWPARG